MYTKRFRDLVGTVGRGEDMAHGVAELGEFCCGQSAQDRARANRSAASGSWVNSVNAATSS